MGCYIKYIKFCILEGPSSFNAILGSPWLHEMKAIPSTYSGQIPTKNRDRQIKGDQAAFRAYYENGLKPYSTAA